MQSYRNLLFFSTLFALPSHLKEVNSIELINITYDVFSNGHYSGTLAAFGDFNSDKLTDVFCISPDGRKLDILFSNDTRPYLGQRALNCTFESNITGVIPADYNGDSMMDVMITLQEGNGKVIHAVVLWGTLNDVKCSSEIVFNLSSQPFILDYNDDMIPDVMGEDESKKRSVWLSSKTKNFTKIQLPGEHLPLRKPHSSAILDLNSDLVSDLLITSNESIEIWIKHGVEFSLKHYIPYPKKAVFKGQSTFVDFNTNSILEHVMPVCYDANCKESAIVIWSNLSSTWITVLKDFTYENTTWGFVVDVTTLSVLEKAASPVTLRAGDFNMDGYPDFITVLQSKPQSEQRKAIFLENVPCDSCPFSRELKVHWDVPVLKGINNVQLVAFFDMFEDGAMDILLSTKLGSEWKVSVLKNVGAYDAYFIKVLVLSGMCYSDCQSNHIPYGTNQPGPMITYNTTKSDGEPLASCAVQMPQSAHFPLQLPYSVLGFGQTPNFVDHLVIAIPEMMGNKIHMRDWTQIIPNSQMVVIPFPPAEEHLWVNKLFLTPSHLVFLTIIALIGTCGFVAFIIGILHWKERREDIKEKKQDAYRFHFDAM